jgi:UDP-N-acetylglucosamine--N-acetylmuramyl-(pentapeptide) pyrophosphoryl-undecaprenol N-acetylglucosamine transferase
MKKIILTGGGTAGHVTPNLALLEDLKNNGFEIKYIGRKEGIEKELAQKNNIEYIGISSGKLRRYVSAKNVSDMFRVVKGLGDAIKIIKSEKPNVIFSKGGFVTVPVVIAGKICGVPVIIHESDITPGLANKIAIPYAKTICTSFPETIRYLPKNKSVLTGSPIRKELFLGDKMKGKSMCGFDEQKPVLLVTGGSLGSVYINKIITSCIQKLTKDYQIVHICGKGNVNNNISIKGYKQFEYVNEGLSDLFAMADIIISRAGSNSIYEFLALQKLNILVPLSKKASRGDQILNAKSFAKQGFSYVIEEDEFNEHTLTKGLTHLIDNKQLYKNKMKESELKNGITEIIKIIETTSL